MFNLFQRQPSIHQTIDELSSKLVVEDKSTSSKNNLMDWGKQSDDNKSDTHNNFLTSGKNDKNHETQVDLSAKQAKSLIKFVS